jgi:hypothetical protein
MGILGARAVGTAAILVGLAGVVAAGTHADPVRSAVRTATPRHEVAGAAEPTLGTLGLGDDGQNPTPATDATTTTTTAGPATTTTTGAPATTTTAPATTTTAVPAVTPAPHGPAPATYWVWNRSSQTVLIAVNGAVRSIAPDLPAMGQIETDPVPSGDVIAYRLHDDSTCGGRDTGAFFEPGGAYEIVVRDDPTACGGGGVAYRLGTLVPPASAVASVPPDASKATYWITNRAAETMTIIVNAQSHDVAPGEAIGPFLVAPGADPVAQAGEDSIGVSVPDTGCGLSYEGVYFQPAGRYEIVVFNVAGQECAEQPGAYAILRFVDDTTPSLPHTG